MADNLTLNSGSGGGDLATDQTGGASGPHYQRVKLTDGTADSTTVIAAGNGTAATALRVTVASDSTGVLSVDDNGSSLTVDNAGLTELAAAINSNQVDVNLVASAATVTVDLGANNDVTIDNSSIVHVDDAAFTLGTSAGVMMMGFAGTQSVDANDAAALACDTDGALHISDGGNSITVDGTVTANAGTNLNTSALALESGGNLATIAGDTTSIDGKMTAGEGVKGAAVQRVTVATDDTLVTNSTTIAGAVSGTEMQVDVVAALPAGDNNIGNVDIASALPAGTNAIGKLAANSGVDIGDVDVTSISAGTNLIGDVGISGARTSGGTTLYKNIDVDESEAQVKGTAGQVYWIHAMNLSSGVRYLKLYNGTAASVTVGTTVPDLTFPLATQGDTNGAGFILAIPNGIAFSTAITIAATTGVADNDSGAPGANEVVVNLGYA